MNRYSHIAPGTVVLLLVCCVNLCLLALAIYWEDEAEGSSSETPTNDRRTAGRLSLVLASASQMLYVVFGALWWFELMKFYPGRPIETIGILSGLLLSGGALVIGMFGTGLRRTAVAFVGFTTGLLWLLSAVASVAV
jgi:hypothetical protein